MQFEIEDKILTALGVNPERCFITTMSTVGDFYYYYYNDISAENDKAFDDLISKASKELKISISEDDYIVDLVKKLYA